ncbi:MAG TPA: hypothetical protein PLB35_06995 [Myxococcota bacterium]|nr:hypothetical protein [Myxococcota bacterium]HOH76986.1 hypothetical protein [Myxococcota bacterium]
MRKAIFGLTIAVTLSVGCGSDWIAGYDLIDDAVVADIASDLVPGDSTGDPGVDANRGDVVEDAADNGDVAVDAVGETVSPVDSTEVLAEDAVQTDLNVPFMEERAGWAWNSSPLDGEPTQVVYRHLESRQGKLTGKFADVWNCLREDGGPIEQMYWDGIVYDIQLCHYKQTVVPGPDGTYLHVLPPESARDGNDPFAEGHTYYCVNRVHDFFTDQFGHTDNDRSLQCVVNMGFQVLGSPGWMPLDNAAFLPDASYGFMGFNMGDGELLAFGQGRRLDFSSDSSVVFHEYTHFLVGRDRLSLNTGDKYGFSGDPPGMNEGFADYFASTILDYPVLGEYSLGDDSRDLSEFKRCPDHYVGESHYDGRIWSSTLWDIRTKLGITLADELAYRTLIATEMTSTFKTASESLLEIAGEISPENVDAIRAILEEHNVLDCSRVLEYGTDLAEKGYYLPGKMDSYAYEFQTSVASPFQYRIEVPEGSNGFLVYFLAEDMYGYDEAPEVKLMVKRGEDPINWSYRDRPVPDADKSFEATRLNSKDVMFTVAGSCVTPGVYHVQLLNKASYSIVSRVNTVSFPADFSELTWDTCQPADEGIVEQGADAIESDIVDDTI